jgi:integrase
MAASRYGEGTAFLDKSKPGRWYGFVEMGRDENGRRRRKKVTGTSRRQVQDRMREITVARRAGKLKAEPPKPKPVRSIGDTTGDWLRFWVDDILPGTVAASTERQYRETVRDWITPHVGKIPLDELRPEHVVAMMRALDARGLSATTQKKARTILRRALTIAERFGRVTRNVAALTDPPKGAGESKIDDALDADQAARVLAEASGDRLEALAVLVLALGVRQGEALDLRWPDIDLRKGTLLVHCTKSTASDRRIALPDFVVAALRDHQKAQKVERLAAPVWGDPDLVFTTSIGTRIHRRNILRWWHALTVRAGVGRRRFHASRHTAATLMLNNGVPLEVVSATLGHAGLAITADVYAKVRPELQRTAADAMQNVLGTGAGR